MRYLREQLVQIISTVKRKLTEIRLINVFGPI